MDRFVAVILEVDATDDVIEVDVTDDVIGIENVVDVDGVKLPLPYLIK